MKKILFIIVFVAPLFAFAQYKTEEVHRYVEEYKDYAVKLMREELIPASVRLAQAIHATEAGTNKLCMDANNHFAIMCPDDHQGSSFTVKEGTSKKCYLSYRYPAVSWADHSISLRSNDRFAPLFKLNVMDYKGWAQGLQRGKYSNTPDYANTLISIIESHGLARFDTVAMRELEVTKKATVPDNVYSESGIEVVMQKQPKPTVEQECKKDSVEIKIAEEKIDLLLSVFTAKEFEYNPVYYPHAKRNVYENNKVKFVLAKLGDSYEGIARELNVLESAIRGYNDVFDQNLKPIAGEVVYIEAKNKKSPAEYHTISKGESARFIAQKYAVPLSLLFERNNETYDAFGVGNVICISCKK
ncbi:MAG: glucosaminidase domain-containing protein [Bacteroidales bacterium]|nr:glucosaminidase domain-containing protein [Bacteroidales bacterium]